ncbi:hypothetical protein [Pseudobacillus wudalianchiensis]|uniref:Uncharacterized protein n=1 Tax=Pseudobacillus wudalianchiensis TaxID=1743143 RepID=A0A1B9B2N6_9BACI|nr:hypothetical protein [Bacillus wudalianchiensis]OCA90296.1 hypothetical protein A8F95_21105 [Bacillus wudalianchiensis]
MFNKLVFTTLSIALISGAALTANLLAEPSSSDIPSSPKLSAPGDSLANNTDTDSLVPELSDPEESKMTPDISPEILRLRSVGKIYTKHGDYVRVEKQTIFNESEIARNKSQIGDDTKQLILDYGIFLRDDTSSN